MFHLFYIKYLIFFLVGLASPFYLAKGIYTLQKGTYFIRIPKEDKKNLNLFIMEQV